MEIAARLRQLGFPSNYVGFPYLACAISLVQTEPEYLYQVFKCLYPAVATAFQTSAACVERDIRTLLCAYWRSGGPAHYCRPSLRVRLPPVPRSVS